MEYVQSIIYKVPTKSGKRVPRLLNMFLNCKLQSSISIGPLIIGLQCLLFLTLVIKVMFISTVSSAKIIQ